MGQTGPVPGTNRDSSLGQTGRFLSNFTVKSPFRPVCFWDRWGFQEGKRSLNIKFLGRISHGRPGRYPGGRPGTTTFTPSLGAQENKAFCVDGRP